MSEKVVMERFERNGAAQVARKRCRRRCGGMLLAIMIAMLPIPGSLLSHAAVTDGLSDALVSQERIAAATGTSISFSDVAEKAWYASDLRFITNDSRKILEGMPDGRFHPADKLSVEQFLKCVVVAANQRPAPRSGYWAHPYIDKALEMGIVDSSQFASFREGISRGEMAQIIATAFAQMTGESVPAVDASSVSKRMKDYAMIPAHQREAVCLAYSVGILTGMPDGKFHPEGILSRAEAVAVIRRVIDPSARIQVGDDTVDATDDVESVAASGVSSEVWSDEEFQTFMASDEWKNYLNPNTIAGMEDGVLLFYDFIPAEDGTIAGQERFPRKLAEPIYSKYYELAKTLGYHAKMLEGMATVSYTERFGGSILFLQSNLGSWVGNNSNLCFSVQEERMSSFAPDFPQYFPSKNISEINIIWTYGVFFSIDEFNSSYLDGRLKDFDYSQQKYVNAFADVAKIIYTSSIAGDFVDYVINKYDRMVTVPLETAIVEEKIYANGFHIYSVLPRYNGRKTLFTNRGE